MTTIYSADHSHRAEVTVDSEKLVSVEIWRDRPSRMRLGTWQFAWPLHVVLNEVASVMYPLKPDSILTYDSDLRRVVRRSNYK